MNKIDKETFIKAVADFAAAPIERDELPVFALSFEQMQTVRGRLSFAIGLLRVGQRGLQRVHDAVPPDDEFELDDAIDEAGVQAKRLDAGLEMLLLFEQPEPFTVNGADSSGEDGVTARQGRSATVGDRALADRIAGRCDKPARKMVASIASWPEAWKREASKWLDKRGDIHRIPKHVFEVMRAEVVERDTPPDASEVWAPVSLLNLISAGMRAAQELDNEHVAYQSEASKELRAAMETAEQEGKRRAKLMHEMECALRAVVDACDDVNAPQFWDEVKAAKRFLAQLPA